MDLALPSRELNAIHWRNNQCSEGIQDAAV